MIFNELPYLFCTKIDEEPRKHAKTWGKRDGNDIYPTKTHQNVDGNIYTTISYAKHKLYFYMIF